MAIRTTFNIKSNLKKRLDKASDKLNVPIDSLIGNLIGKIMKDKRFKHEMFRCIAYQKRAKKRKDWHIQHIYFESKVYEIAHDLRKVFKMSVSLIIAKAIELYLKEVVEELMRDKKNLDNYPRHYVFKSGYYKGLLNFFVSHSKIPPKTMEKRL